MEVQHHVKSSSADSLKSASHASASRSATRPPAPAFRAQTHRVDYDLADALTLENPRPSYEIESASLLKAACEPSSFGSLSGSTLVAAVKAAEVGCINDLFDLTGSSASATFREAQMASIATALQSAAANYNGTNSGSTLQLILFLRAGYYVQYYNPSTVGSYGSTLRNAIRPALDAFAANSNFLAANDAHGEILAEYVTLLDSSDENGRYLNVIKRLLTNYNPSTHSSYYWMRVATNNVFSVLYRGQWSDEYLTAIQNDTSIIDTLYTFANTHLSRLNQNDSYLVYNAGREMGRFLMYTGNAKARARVRVKELLDRTNVSGPTASVWVGVGEMVESYDKSNCSYYNTCDFVARVEAAALPITHTCSPTLRLRAQSMSQSDINYVCSTVAGEETYFHNKLATNNTPVANDVNASLEMVVFDSSSDYETYAGTLFGIDTDNGGMYLEGDPAVPGNQARFIAYEAEWLRPTFDVWNLTHEYIHYLDGRFNMYGDFELGMRYPTVWWSEGFAEYMSYSYRNLSYDRAITEAGRGTYPLSTIFGNDYSSGSARVYQWGYLAVRFLFEKRPEVVRTILGNMRSGNYSGYESYLNSIRTTYNGEFSSFLTCVANPNSSGCSGGGSNQLPVASFSFVANNLTVNFTDGSSDSDGTIASRSWNFGDGTSSTATNPSKTYTTAGTYSVALTVTDNSGGSQTTTRSVTVTAPQTGGTQLQNGVARTGLSAAQGEKLYFTIDVPAGATNLKVALSGGTGDGDLHVRFGSNPTTADFDCRPYTNGNNETCDVATPQAGRYYVMVNAYAAFSGASLVASYSTSGGGSGSLTECTGSDPRTLGKNCKRSNISGTSGNTSYFYVMIPAGTPQLRIRSTGGTGNADLYANASGWATPTSYQQRSIGGTNEETLTIANPPAGYYYISLHSTGGFSGVTLSTEF
ncbi:MAG: collagenase [Rhodanobacteraceae bacterium]|nr:collagenase [Rhodanobacteraceae bacterium]